MLYISIEQQQNRKERMEMFAKEKEQLEKKLIVKEMVLRRFGSLHQFAIDKNIPYNNISRYIHYIGDHGTAASREMIVYLRDEFGFDLNEISIHELRVKLKLGV